MKRSLFIAVFIVINISLVVLHLQKQSRIIKLSYLKQKNEHEKSIALKNKQELTHQLYTLHDRDTVKKFAATKLGMKPIQISQVKRLYDK